MGVDKDEQGKGEITDRGICAGDHDIGGNLPQPDADI
jgi:hypothetical protein